MADKFQDFAGRLRNAGGGGAPRGLGMGVKLLVGALAGAYGLQQSMYTGKTKDSRSFNAGVKTTKLSFFLSFSCS